MVVEREVLGTILGDLGAIGPVLSAIMPVLSGGLAVLEWHCLNCDFGDLGIFGIWGCSGDLDWGVVTSVGWLDG